MYEIKWRTLHPLHVAIVEERLDGFGIDDIGNLEDLLRVVFIDEENGNLKVVIDGGDLTKNKARPFASL